jgi:hypothetical protein
MVSPARPLCSSTSSNTILLIRRRQLNQKGWSRAHFWVIFPFWAFKTGFKFKKFKNYKSPPHLRMNGRGAASGPQECAGPALDYTIPQIGYHDGEISQGMSLHIEHRLRAVALLGVACSVQVIRT